MNFKFQILSFKTIFKLNNFKLFLNSKFKIRNSREGMVALLTIIIVGAAVFIMAFSASLLGLGELEMGYDSQQGEESFAIVDGCMEEALRHLRIDNTYAGDTLNLGGGSCIISVVSAGNDRTVSVIATLGNYSKSLEVDLTLSGDNSDIITVNSWEEIGN